MPLEDVFIMCFVVLYMPMIFKYSFIGLLLDIGPMEFEVSDRGLNIHDIVMIIYQPRILS